MPAIRADQLGKMYRVPHGAPRAQYRMLRDALAATIAYPVRRLTGNAPPPVTYEKFWALKDVSFEIQPGEVVGIIGRNGAGKSTLLKILSRITKPSTGQVEINGRVSSLLEVGTGFHPELTGRENVYLNGSLLGMSRREIDRKFADIVAFAEVENFLDTPVKRFSSGMYVRLAFAVAAHLEPEILIVDEVLAVGDTAFQKKCLGKLGEVTRHGRTVFFVSHNMQAVAQLTQRCMLMDHGRIQFNGPTEKALQIYHDGTPELAGNRAGGYSVNGPVRKNRVASAFAITSEPNALHRYGAPIRFEFEIDVAKPSGSLCFSFQVINAADLPVAHFWQFQDGPWRRKPGRYKFVCNVPRFRLYMGSYTLTTHLSDRLGDDAQESLTGICPFDVTMIHEHREEYDWHAGAAAYVEDFEWSEASP